MLNSMAGPDFHRACDIEFLKNILHR